VVASTVLIVSPGGTAAPPTTKSPTTRSGPPPDATTEARRVELSPAARQRLAVATVTRKPVTHVPFSRQAVRKNVRKSGRRSKIVNGKVREPSVAELTAELNRVERQLNDHGFTLRDTRPVVVHEHRKDGARLLAQQREIESVRLRKPTRSSRNP
jgi:hypothetical protein